MKTFLILLSSMLLTGCSGMLPMLSPDDLKNETSLRIDLDKEAFEKNSNVHIVIDVINVENVK